MLLSSSTILLTVLQEHGVHKDINGDDGARFRYNLNVQTTIFVEEELHHYYHKLVNFVKDIDSKLIKNPNAPIEKGSTI